MLFTYSLRITYQCKKQQYRVIIIKQIKVLSMSIDLTKIPKLGFGLMRLPENNGVIDHEQVCNMVENLYRANKYVITAADQAP